MISLCSPRLTKTGAVNVPRTPLNFMIQNCNSLNLTGSTVNFDLKLAAVLQSRADIILLSDTRIITANGISASQRIDNCLRDCKYRRYKALFNSSRNSRGVAIFIAADLSFVVHREFRDMLENYLIIDVEINNIRYGVGAIYGPNNTAREFFHGLSNCLSTLRAEGTSEFILGGGLEYHDR
jgi:hypothetical protein